MIRSIGIVLAIDAAITAGMATVLGLGCAWVIAHDPVAPNPYPDSGPSWEPPNTLEGFCGGNPGACPQGPAPNGVWMGKQAKEGGGDANE